MPAVLTVDLDIIERNFVRLQQTAGVPLMPVVKASGYGVDRSRVALRLQRAGARHFMVAYPDEGITLRQDGITAPILVQNVLPEALESVVQHDLAVQVSDPALFSALDAEAVRQGREVRVHLKIDSGMGRAGALPQDAVPLAAAIRASTGCVLDGLMTHFSSADDPAADAVTRAQITCFQHALDQIGADVPWVHASNSAGIERFPGARFTCVRAGLALYGYAGGPEQEAALTLTTQVIAVRSLPPGSPIGYGGTAVFDHPAKIATVALGYGDGYPWALSNLGWMKAGGVRCSVVGRVCMDVTMLDVTDAQALGPGDGVTVFGGDGPTLPALAELAGTLPYELMTRLTPRIRRVFESTP